MGNQQDFVSKPKSKAFRHGPLWAVLFGAPKKPANNFAGWALFSLLLYATAGGDIFQRVISGFAFADFKMQVITIGIACSA